MCGEADVSKVLDKYAWDNNIIEGSLDIEEDREDRSTIQKGRLNPIESER